MAIYALDERRVRLPANGSAWIADNAAVVGSVTLEEDTTVWFNAVIRGDNDPIHIGARSNIQDGCVLHADPGFPLVVGPDCIIGHMVMLHGCRIGRGSLIGIGAIVLNGAEIGDECIIGAGALVPEGKKIPPRSLVMGSPGKIIRAVTDDDVARIRDGVANYQGKGKWYTRGLKPDRA